MNMLDFEVQRFSRRCHATDEPIEAGQVYYSVLIAEGGDVVRRDFSLSAWKGPPDTALGWWKAQVPDAQAGRVHWAPNDVMLHYFEQLEPVAEKADTRYVLALLMIRRRIIRLEETEVDSDGQECFLVHCPRNEREYRVRVVTPSRQRVEAIQQELAELLFADSPENHDSSAPAPASETGSQKQPDSS